MTERHLDDDGSEPVFDFYCEFCREDGKMLEAEGYCVDCGEYLCDTCYTHHKRSRGSRHHVLMDKDNMPKDTPLSHDQVNKDISKKCDHHPGEPVKYYCKSHEFIGCNVCFIKGHRNCSNIESIEEMAKSIMASQEYTDFIQILQQLSQKAQSNIKLVQDNLPKSRNWCSDVAKSLQRFRKKINSVLDELEQTIITQAENLQKEEEKKLMSISDRVTTTLQSVEQAAEELGHLQTSRKVCEIFIKLKKSQREVEAMQAILDEAGKENVVCEYVFKPSTKLKKNLQNQTGFGKLSIQASTTAAAKTSPHYDPVNTKATYVTDIEVISDKARRTCSITGSAVVSNHRLIIVDNTNCIIQLVDTQFSKVISELTVSGWPWDITVIGRNQAAVTVYDNEKIFLLSVSDTLSLDRKISVSGQCMGVAYNNNRLVVTYTNPIKLEIMDLSGNVMKRIVSDSGGCKLFKCPGYVCISKDEETIYVSDFTSEKLTSLTFEGEVKSVYFNNKQLRAPQKACVDNHGNVYVCCSDFRNVCMLTADFTKVQNILTPADGLESNVYSVSHCQETNRLYVGMCSKKMKVFRLSQ